MSFLKHGWFACLALAACTLNAGADPPTLKDARHQWLRGHYEEARELYQKLAKEETHRAAAAIGLSRVQQSKGEYAEALLTIDTALGKESASAELLARQAELLYLQGRWDDALKTADKALSANDGQFLARWVRAQVQRDRGDVTKADAEFRWFVRTYSDRSNHDQDIKDPDALLLIGLAGAENARWNRLADQFGFILNEVYGDAIKLDADFWPAEYQAGMLLLEKYNRGEALDAFDKALGINPNAAEALVGKGIAALQKLDLSAAEQFVQSALKINPDLPEALRLRADVHLASGDLDKALRNLERARKVNPRNEETLGRLAACYYLQHEKAAFEKLVGEVEKQDAKPGVFYAELAERLEDRRRFDDAEPFYQKAAELRPQLSGPRAALGLLYMRMGKEGEARKLLDDAFKADPFNVRVSNNLKVLRHLDKYETLKTEHFELRFDPKQDRILAQYMAIYLEQIYAGLAKQFQFQPSGRILVEVFNSHEMFSGRIVSLPDLHTIGACTGRIFAMVSPRGQGVPHPFNWARVLRHEMVHIFNLEQTHFQVPHWLTEGLAVENEGLEERPQVWNDLLRERVPEKRLKPLADIDLGFIRPASPMEWHLAYCQSQLYVQYLRKRFGEGVPLGLLAAYGDGQDTAAAIRKVCQVDVPDFEKGYRAFVEDIVKKLPGKPAEKALGFRELKEAQAKDPGNLDLTARLAEQHLRRRERAEARKLADAVLAKAPHHPLASYVKASLLHSAGQDKEALELLEAAVDERNPEPKVVQELAKLYFNAKDSAKAARMYELALVAEPYERKWLEGLARVYADLGERDKQIDVLKKLARFDPDDLDTRRRLTRLFEEAGRHAEAETYARQVLEIDVMDRNAQGTFLRALLDQKKEDEARKYQRLFRGDF